MKGHINHMAKAVENTVYRVNTEEVACLLGAIKERTLSRLLRSHEAYCAMKANKGQ